MDAVDAGESQQDELVLGVRSRRVDRAALAGAALLLAAVAAVAGWRVGRGDRHAAAPPSHAPHGAKLVVGSFVANHPADFEGPQFLVTLYNVGDRPARVTSIAPQQWRAVIDPVTVPGGGSAVVPVEVDLDCRYSPPPSNAVTVHMTSAGRSTVQTAKLASTPEAITEKWERVCATPNGRVPRRADLVGIWSVERADFFAGRMLIELRADGTFALDPFTTLFTDPGKYGDYRYRSGRLMLVSRGGQDCPKGDRSLWQVGLLSDGQLRIRILNQYDSVCRAADGEVWIARRVSPPAPSRRRSQ